MGDLLVKLYDLPEPPDFPGEIVVTRPLVPDRRRLVNWVEKRFGDRWASEVETAFSRHPVTAFVALDGGGTPLGFACHDTTFRGFFGPLGVDEAARGRGIGTALLFRSLVAMREAGHAYAIVGYSGSDDFYQRTVGAIPIPDSEPGAYRGWIAKEETKEG